MLHSLTRRRMKKAATNCKNGAACCAYHRAAKPVSQCVRMTEI
jgi:hypothetical protein